MNEVIHVASKPHKPVMIFDGDCNFCRRWIRRWQYASGDSVDYVPFQDPMVSERFPEIRREQCERAVQFVNTDGQVFSGAEAVFQSLSHDQRKRWPLWIYQHVPGAAALT